MKTSIFTLFILAFFTSTSAFAEDGHQHEQGHDDMAIHDMDMGEDEHDDHGTHGEDSHGGEEEGAPIELSPAQMKQAGITTTLAQLQAEKDVVQALGSVSFNAYNIADVTALVDAIVDTRHVRLGEHVKRGQRVVTLNSSALAQAQADYLRAEAAQLTSKLELARLQSLVNEKIISQSRFQKAQSQYRADDANLAASLATLSSFGMRQQDVKRLKKSNDYGKLTLRSARAGTVAADDFVLGQHIAAGTRLMQIVDESSVWVQVKLASTQMENIQVGQAAVVTYKAETYPARVINISHQLDAATRTVSVRLEVQNPDDVLHPGMFVSADIETNTTSKANISKRNRVISLPLQSVQRQGGELIVFVEEEAGHFERREVQVGKTSMGRIVILQGIKAGERIVVNGAFTLTSELAKSGFAVHNH